MHGLLVGVSNSLPQDLTVCFRAANSGAQCPVLVVRSLWCQRRARLSTLDPFLPAATGRFGDVKLECFAHESIFRDHGT